MINPHSSTELWLTETHDKHFHEWSIIFGFGYIREAISAGECNLNYLQCFGQHFLSQIKKSFCLPFFMISLMFLIRLVSPRA